jgi:hypothetical protein
VQSGILERGRSEERGLQRAAEGALQVVTRELASKKTTQDQGKNQPNKLEGNEAWCPHKIKSSACSYKSEWKNLMISGILTTLH